MFFVMAVGQHSSAAGSATIFIKAKIYDPNNTQTARLPDIDQQLDGDFEMQDTADDLPTMSFSGPAVTDAHKNKIQEQFHVTIDLMGDFFGDYANYAALDF
jgi:hypothetical protein